MQARGSLMHRLAVGLVLALALLLALVASASAATVSLSLSGTGAGTVTSSPAGIACSIEGGVTSGTCSASFANKSSVILTASPKDAASVFFGWTLGAGTCTGSATVGNLRTPCQLTTDALGATTSLAAKFVPTPAPPIVKTGPAGIGDVWYLAELAGWVNPNGAQLGICSFEYDTVPYLTTEAPHGVSVPCQPEVATISPGTTAVPIGAETEPLEPNTT